MKSNDIKTGRIMIEGLGYFGYLFTTKSSTATIILFKSMTISQLLTALVACEISCLVLRA